VWQTSRSAEALRGRAFQTVKRLSARVVDDAVAGRAMHARMGRPSHMTVSSRRWLCVYREVQVLKKAAKCRKAHRAVAIVSYDEKPAIQAIATTAPDLPPKPGVYPTFARDHEYKRHGTLSLLAGIDLLTGKVHALVRDHHRSREFRANSAHFETYPAWRR
jgi:hypothetical protein